MGDNPKTYSLLSLNIVTYVLQDRKTTLTSKLYQIYLDISFGLKLLPEVISAILSNT